MSNQSQCVLVSSLARPPRRPQESSQRSFGEHARFIFPLRLDLRVADEYVATAILDTTSARHGSPSEPKTFGTDLIPLIFKPATEGDSVRISLFRLLNLAYAL